MLLPFLLVAALTIFSNVTECFTKEDFEQDCYEALHDGGKLEKCAKTAEQKWNLVASDGNPSKSATVRASCCAIYDALNCAQNRSCTICPGKDLTDWAAFRVRAIGALGKTMYKEMPYEQWDKHCEQNGGSNDAPPLDMHCDNEPGDATEASSYKTAIIIALVVIVIIIMVAIIGLIIHLIARDSHEYDDTKTQSTHGGQSVHRTKSIRTNKSKFIPVKATQKMTNVSKAKVDLSKANMKNSMAQGSSSSPLAQAKQASVSHSKSSTAGETKSVKSNQKVESAKVDIQTSMNDIGGKSSSPGIVQQLSVKVPSHS